MPSEPTPPDASQVPATTHRPYPRLQIEPDQLEAVASLHATYANAAAYFDMSMSTFQRRLRESPALRCAWKRGKAKTDIRLRQEILNRALDVKLPGSTRCLLFLGKSICGMNDGAPGSVGVDPDDLVEEQNEEAAAIENAAQTISGWTPDQIRRFAETGIEPSPSELASEAVIEAEVVTPKAGDDERPPL